MLRRVISFMLLVVCILHAQSDSVHGRPVSGSDPVTDTIKITKTDSMQFHLPLVSNRNQSRHAIGLGWDNGLAFVYRFKNGFKFGGSGMVEYDKNNYSRFYLDNQPDTSESEYESTDQGFTIRFTGSKPAIALGCFDLSIFGMMGYRSINSRITRDGTMIDYTMRSVILGKLGIEPNAWLLSNRINVGTRVGFNYSKFFTEDDDSDKVETDLYVWVADQNFSINMELFAYWYW